MKQKIVITGATGFLGSHLYTHLQTLGERLVAASFRGNKAKRIASLDIRDMRAVRSFIAKVKPDVVYHLAALVDLSRDFAIGRQCFERNTLGTFHLLDACKDIRGLRFIYTSTEEVYGETPTPYREDQLPAPPSPYAISKVAAEELCAYYASQYGFRAVVLRIGTLYGPGQPAHRYLTQVIAHALKGEAISMNSGMKKRDYIYIEDAVDALVKAKSARVPTGSTVVNVGGRESIELRAAVRLIKDICQSTSRVNYGSIPERETEADEWLMDIRRAQDILGWSPKTAFRDGMKKMVEYERTQ